MAPGEALKDAGRGLAGDRRFAVRGTLVVAQIAVSLMLITAAGLFLRSFASLNQLPLGLVPEPLLIAELRCPAFCFTGTYVVVPRKAFTATTSSAP